MKKILVVLGLGGFAMLAISSTCSTEPKASEPTKNIKRSDLNIAKQDSEGIKFSGMRLEAAKKEAAKEGKLIFIDAYTEWCGPCKIMAKTSFKDPKVAELFNANFINLKIEMEKDPDGREVAMKYSVKAYPTLLIIDSEGNLVKQTLGLQSAERLLDFGKSVL
jgi:thiol:disulfide interchange protein